MKRRDFLTSSAALLTYAGIGGNAWASQEVFERMRRDRLRRNTSTEQNVEAALSSIQSSEPILSFDTAYSIELGIERYEQIRSAGGWDETSRSAIRLRLGFHSSQVPHLKRRLMAEGDLEWEKRLTDGFDGRLDAALRRFQVRHGLHATGRLDEATWYALNVPVEDKLRQLRLNFTRVENVAGRLTDRYVLVNIPAASAEAVRNKLVERRHVAIVGRGDRQTPLLSSKIHEINFNPPWHVPKSIIRRDIIGYVQKYPNYLIDNKIRIYDARGNEVDPLSINWRTDEAVSYAFRQEPGERNSLGRVKINFPNRHAVYLHDTPSKQLFGENFRFASSGCVRIQKVDELVAWLLDSNGGWDVGAVNAIFDSGALMNVRVKQRVPVHTTYITAWANRQGTVSFRNDIYGFDEAGLAALSELMT